MTDLEYIKNMFDKENISYKYLSEKEYGRIDESLIILEVERGYSGFVTCFTFDKYGNFKDIGAYE